MPVRQAFTLLEVIISLAILAVSLVVLVEVSRLSLQNAKHAALETEAALVAESVLAELEAGTAELTSVAGEWIDNDNRPADWIYEVVVEPAGIEGLLAARVIVSESDPTREAPIRFELVRWFQDPLYVDQLLSAEQAGG